MLKKKKKKKKTKVIDALISNNRKSEAIHGIRLQ